MGGAELKYTDRDVRDNPGQMFALVEEYLNNYTGEFDFLVDCKMRVAQNVSLTTGMVRGVLNCMRSDPRIRLQMPAPRAYDEEEEAEVVPIGRKRKKQCSITEPHPPHDETDETWYCRGVYEINRSRYDLPATIKAGYVVARTGALVHQATGVGSVLWLPNAHEFGFVSHMKIHGSGVYSSSDISAQTWCKAWIRNPVLLDATQAAAVVCDRRWLDEYLTEKLGFVPPPSQRKILSVCSRCEVERASSSRQG